MKVRQFGSVNALQLVKSISLVIVLYVYEWSLSHSEHEFIQSDELHLP